MHVRSPLVLSSIILSKCHSAVTALREAEGFSLEGKAKILGMWDSVCGTQTLGFAQRGFSKGDWLERQKEGTSGLSTASFGPSSGIPLSIPF